MALERRSAGAAHWSQEQYDWLFADAGPKRLVLVIEEQNRALGFVVARPAAAIWEIENIAVTEQARRRGLGARLLGEFLEHARNHGAEAVFLEVRESNQPARALYEKWAFVESGRRTRYYRDPEEDAIVYRLSLT